MTLKTNPRTTEAVDTDIDEFLAANHDEIASKLEAARASIARGEAAPLEPLEALLSEARARARHSA